MSYQETEEHTLSAAIAGADPKKHTQSLIKEFHFFSTERARN
jgi:hypothetical protein